MRKKIYTAVAVAAAVLLISGATMLATASPATNEDPLITLSYLNGPYRAAIGADIANQLGALAGRVAAAENSIRTELAAARAGANTFALINLAAGATHNIPAGSEVMMESGAVAFAGNLVNTTSAQPEAASGSLAQYNMYVATGAVALTAAADSKIWVRNTPGA